MERLVVLRVGRRIGSSFAIRPALMSLLMLILLFGGTPAPRAQELTRFYVNARATGARTGASWANAYCEIDDAVAAAAAGGGEVWVAQGTYQRPVTMRAGVAVYGGFAGTESKFAERNPATRPTVIDVSRARDGMPAEHAVLCLDVAGVLLDGFTITGGQAASPADPDGGGLLCRVPKGGVILVSQCTITGNRALGNGGGACVLTGTVAFTGCTFTSNTAQGQGGGLAFSGMGISADECTFRANSARSGGGVAGGGPGIALRNCEILFNRAAECGGGVAATTSTLALAQCRLLENQASRGGGLWSSPEASFTVQGCILGGNTAREAGGGVYYEGQHDLQRGWLTECTLSGNHAPEGGALAARTPLAVHGSLLSGNTAGRGGALAVDPSGIDLFGCTLSDNAATDGGALFAPQPPAATVDSCIFSGNTGSAIRIGAASANPGELRLRYCLFANNRPGDYHDGVTLWTGAGQINTLLPRCFGNLGGDPCFMAGVAGSWTAPPAFDPDTSMTTLIDASASFAPDALAGRPIAFPPESRQALVLRNTANTITLAGDWTGACPAGAAYQVLDYHLGAGSHALRTGLPAMPMALDLDGEPRESDAGWIDSGADQTDMAEPPAPAPDQTAPVSRVAPLPELFRGAVLTLNIEATDDLGGLVRVLVFYRRDGGPWHEMPDCEFLMRSGQSVPCRFDAEAAGGSGDYEFYTMAIDEAGNTEAPPATSDATIRISIPYPDHCVYVNSQATEEQTGESWSSAYRQIHDGVADAIAEGLTVVRVAGGKYTDLIELLGEDLPDGLTIEGGYYRAADGTLARDPFGHPTIVVGSREFADPQLQPSVICLIGTSKVLLDGLILTGGTSAYGGGLWVADCDASNEIRNCVITANHGWNGAGVFIEGQTAAVFSGCRIVGNAADVGGGGITISDGAHPRLVNCVIWGNTAPLGGGVEITNGAAPELIHCTLSGNAANSGGAIACHGLAGALPNLAGSLVRESKGTGAVAELDGDSDLLILGCLFDGNAGGDYLDENKTLLSGAAAIDTLTEAEGNFSGAAALPTGPAGTWSATPAYSAATGCTTLTNNGAALTPGALVGRLINPDTGQSLAALVVANTDRTVTAVGDLTGFVQRYDAYRVLDIRPGAGSAAIDRVAVSGAPAVDIEGHARPFDVTGQGNEAPGATFDIGACEASPWLKVTGSLAGGVLDYGEQPVGVLPAASRTLTLANTGSLNLVFVSPAPIISGPAAGDFAAAGFDAAPLAAGASRSLTLTFAPQAVGARQARLELSAQGAGAPLLQASLAGVGVDVSPVFTLQPAPRTVKPGERVTFTAAATGLQPLTWRWRKGGVALGDGGRLSGTATPTLVISDARQSDEGAYDCVVTNLAGQAVSSGAALDVKDLPVILVQPADLALDPGAVAAFDLQASSPLPMTYRWLRGGVPLENGGAVEGADTPSLRIAGVGQADGGEYCCEVMNEAGATFSRQAMLNVSGPAFIVSNPRDLKVSPGEMAVFRVVAIGTAPIAYEWRKEGQALADGGAITGTRSATLTISGAQMAHEGVYSCLVTNGSGSALSGGARLEIFRNTLHIDPDQGAPNPPAGDAVLTSGSWVNARVAKPTLPDAAGTTRLVCAGWKGAGSPVGPPTATSLTFALDRPSTITWQWKQQVQINLAPEDATQGGTLITGGAGWRDVGASVSIQAVPATGYRFLEWTGDLAGLSNPAEATLSRPLNAAARFIEATPPLGSIQIEHGAAWTSSTAVALALNARDVGSGLASARLSNDGSSWSDWFAYAATTRWTLAPGEGARSVYVQFKDRAGNISDSFSGTIMLDGTVPYSTVTSPSGSTRKGSLTVSWSAVDPPSGGVATGIREVRVYWRLNGGAWQPLGCFGAGVTETLFDTTKAGGNGTYDFYSEAIDQAGNHESATGEPDCTVLVNSTGVAAWGQYE